MRGELGEPGEGGVTMQSAKCKVQSAKCKFRTPKSPLRTSSGFTYTALLAAIVIIGITLGAAGKYWSHVMLREKEEELLFRGEQYRQAIERYYTALPGRNEYPPDIDNLLKDGRTATGKRHLREKYEDFENKFCRRAEYLWLRRLLPASARRNTAS